MADNRDNAATCRRFRLSTIVVGLLLSLPACRDNDAPKSDLRSPSASDPLLAVKKLQSAGRLTDAIEACRRSLEKTPSDGALRSLYAELLSGVGLSEPARQQLQRLVRNTDLSQPQLICLLRNGRQLFSKSQLRRWQEAAPNDPLVRFGLASHAVQDRDFAEALRLLERVPDDASHCRELRLWLTARMKSELRAEDKERLASLLDSEITSSLVWRIAGELLDRRQANDLSLICYMRALASSPWNLELLHVVLERLPSDDTLRPKILDRIGSGTALNQLASRLAVNATDSDIHEAVGYLVMTHRYPEALQWSRLALRLQGNSEWSRDAIRALSHTRPSSDDFGSLLMSRISADTQQVIAAIQTKRPPSVEKSKFDFRDVAANIGLNFSYDNGRDNSHPGLKMHQWTGGGVGVVDVDHDSWPDLYLPQGGTLAEPLPDAVFRNLRGERFSRVRGAFEETSPGYGQGVAVGDVNEDGFDDIYVANIGRNQLLLSQGDGTFQAMNVSDDASWTTSCAIADINGDGYSDLYDCNYLDDKRAFSLTCDHEGEQRVCGPRDFTAAADNLLLSSGDGAFHADSHLTAASVDSRGMGILIGDVLNSGGNRVYVANDETANQLFQLSEDELSETATERGLAFDSFGHSLGSMGITCGDVDGSGTPFFFVTNYLSEPNNLYRGSTSRTFFDAAPSFGLAAGGYPMVGFGCCFSDVDADGDVDLFVANGHLDDFRFLGRPYRMRSQLFENIDEGDFREFTASTGYFSHSFLGRAVAALDWNGDGREDFVVTTIGDNVQLVTNYTPGKFADLGVRVVGTKSCRRPIGARVTLAGKQERQTRWLTAGDGYQASSSPVCRLAVKDASSVKLEVNWPSGFGQTTIVQRGAANLVIIEGRQTGFVVLR